MCNLRLWNLNGKLARILKIYSKKLVAGQAFLCLPYFKTMNSEISLPKTLEGSLNPRKDLHVLKWS
jgi:hypothetical protein